MTTCLGLDIGGANLKAAHSSGAARTVAFPLWRHPERLPAALEALIGSLPGTDALAVTMTGELCDCFESKAAGVRHIVDAVGDPGIRVAHPRLETRFWSIRETWLTADEARQRPLEVAAANWLALAAVVARQFVPEDAGLLVDLGSTTCDVIPLWNGRAVPRGHTDPERLQSGELVYTGVGRTPVCALLGSAVAAELFATTLDVYLTLGWKDEDSSDVDTADGRPATTVNARRRLARMLCADSDQIDTQQLAREAYEVQRRFLESALRRVMESLPATPGTIVVAGSGEFLARRVVAEAFPGAALISLAERWGVERSTAACAYAVAISR